MELNLKLTSLLVIVVIFTFMIISNFTKLNQLKRLKSNIRSDSKRLRLIHIFFRHGMKTPDDTYPKDIYINHTYFPYGHGQLTNIGKQNQYKLGQFLRQRYDDFLGKIPSSSIMHAQSTYVDRTYMSLALTLAGLWPAKNTELEWDSNINWSPNLIKALPLEEDKLLLPVIRCPKYYEELENIYKTPEVQLMMKRNHNLFQELSEYTGLTFQYPDDVLSLFSTLKSQNEFGLRLPKWTQIYFPDKIVELSKTSFIINSYNNELLKLYTGPIIKKIVDDWIHKSSENLNSKSMKLIIFAVHDWTIANILRAFGAWDPQIPDYGATILFEFYEDEVTNQFGIEIFLRNSTEVEPFQLNIAACKKHCSLSEVIKLVKNIIPINWEAECATNNTLDGKFKQKSYK